MNMAPQTCDADAGLHVDSLDTSVFEKPLENYLDCDLNTLFGNHPAYSNFSTNPESAFTYDLLNFHQPSHDLPFTDEGALNLGSTGPQLGSIPPTLPGWDAPLAQENPSTALPQNSWEAETHQTTISAPRPSTPARTQTAVSVIAPPAPSGGGVKKRRSRKKKAPMPPAVKEAKRRVFLEKNRIAAGKCRERNKKKWDGIQERCSDMQAKNLALKEDWLLLKDEVEGLRRLVEEHKPCGHQAMDRWLEMQNTSNEAFELGLSYENMNGTGSDVNFARIGSRSSSSSTSQQGHEIRQASDIQEIQTLSPRNSSSITVSPDPDIGSFSETGQRANLSAAARKTSTTSPNLDIDLDLAPTKDGEQIHSPDSGVDMSYGNPEGVYVMEELFIFT